MGRVRGRSFLLAQWDDPRSSEDFWQDRLHFSGNCVKIKNIRTPCTFSRQRGTFELPHYHSLVDAIFEEDSLLRQRLASCPPEHRDISGDDGTLSFKETLGHIAFWDEFTVDFFKAKTDIATHVLPPPANFEISSQEALQATRRLPFGEVLARYLEATGALMDFLRTHWPELSEKEKHDFWIPVQHRRHHRLALFSVLDGIQDPSQGQTLVAEA